MIYHQTGKWIYFVVDSPYGAVSGVKFYIRGEKHQEWTVRFAGQKAPARDWAGMSLEQFFDKYSRGNLAWLSYVAHKKYVEAAQKRMCESQKRKPINISKFIITDDIGDRYNG